MGVRKGDRIRAGERRDAPGEAEREDDAVEDASMSLSVCTVGKECARVIMGAPVEELVDLLRRWLREYEEERLL